ncbi:MAG: EamA family transporter [Acidimicrobiia bacterium]|nr:EamA family transporter [Acidimicrobiia bacterium]
MWVPITLAAATFQILRTSRQHQLRGVLSTAAAGYVRFAYGAPLAVLASAILFGLLGRAVPPIPNDFWPIIVAAGIAQILGTVALLASFKVRDFAVGTVYSKSEVLILAALGAIGLGTALEPAGWIGAILVTVGVVSLASHGSVRSLTRAADPAALLGLVAGGLFGLTAIGIGEAADRLGGGPSFDRAMLTLTALLVIQAVLNTAWFLVTDRSEIVVTFRAWRPATTVGILSLCGSLGWAWAFTLASAAKVRTLGQVELVIAFLVARLVLRERHTRADYLGSALELVGVLLVTWLG